MTTAGGGSGGSIKLSLLVAILAVASNFGWAYVGMTREDSKEVLGRLSALETKVTAIETTMSVRTPIRDAQFHDLDERLRVVEHPRGR